MRRRTDVATCLLVFHLCKEVGWRPWQTSPGLSLRATGCDMAMHQTPEAQT